MAKLSDFDEERVVAAYPALRRFAFAIADADADPDDLLHEALARVLATKPVHEIDDVVAYVRRAITNVASNRRRSLGRRRRAVERIGAALEREEATDELPSDLADLMVLDVAHRAALYLFVVEGRSHREVAEVLDITETAARTRVSKGLKRMRVDLGVEVRRGHVG